METDPAAGGRGRDRPACHDGERPLPARASAAGAREPAKRPRTGPLCTARVGNGAGSRGPWPRACTREVALASGGVPVCAIQGDVSLSSPSRGPCKDRERSCHSAVNTGTLEHGTQFLNISKAGEIQGSSLSYVFWRNTNAKML